MSAWYFFATQLVCFGAAMSEFGKWLTALASSFNAVVVMPPSLLLLHIFMMQYSLCLYSFDVVYTAGKVLFVPCFTDLHFRSFYMYIAFV